MGPAQFSSAPPLGVSEALALSGSLREAFVHYLPVVVADAEIVLSIDVALSSSLRVHEGT
jgi:hypothetical protein